MDNTACLAALRTAIDRFADLTAASDLDVLVPACPEWDVAALVEHVVGIHTWVRGILAGSEGAGSSGTDLARPERTPSAFSTWYREAGHAMHTDLSERDPGEPCWNFSGTNQVVGFWPRRQLHEINVHAHDHALAAGGELTIAAGQAADGIDELVGMFGPRLARRGIAPALSAPITIAPSDVAATWTLLPPGEAGYAEVTHDAGGSVATISGPASDIYLVMWNRVPHDRITVVGDADVAAAYLASRRVP